jgi:hypothetical protein
MTHDASEDATIAGRRIVAIVCIVLGDLLL